MIGRSSRYRDVPVETQPDRQGRVRAALALRPLPDVTGTHRHVAEAGERLDHLATTYYGRPLDWWHICDANPQFLSPLALVGADPVVTTAVPLVVTPEPPPWSTLLQVVAGRVGVERVRVVDDVDLVTRQVEGGGTRHAVVDAVPVRALQVTHNRARVDAVDIIALIRTVAGVEPGPPDELGRAGQEIVVPPPVRR